MIVLSRAVGGEILGQSRNQLRILRPVVQCATRKNDGRPAVPARRLKHDRRMSADLLQLLGDEKAIIHIGDDDRLGKNLPVPEHGDVAALFCSHHTP